MHEISIGSKLSSLLNNKVNLSNSNSEIICRRGDLYKINDKGLAIFSPITQYTIAGINEGKNWIFTQAMAIPVYDQDYNLDFNTALNLLAKNIIDFAGSAKIKFHIPYLPNRGVMVCNLEIANNLIIRYIEDYLPCTDALAYRFDVLINKEI